MTTDTLKIHAREERERSKDGRLGPTVHTLAATWHTDRVGEAREALESLVTAWGLDAGAKRRGSHDHDERDNGDGTSTVTIQVDVFPSTVDNWVCMLEALRCAHDAEPGR